ncbi:MAG: sensor histidine kinase, partial [Chloroflexota bacterium]|nr:sensor histidine kinase [Chloroflexota bacterium]
GVGIAAEDLPHVLERFYRAHNSDDQPGSGLGLAIVKGIVEAHGGQVTATSRPGVGSRFGFILPVEE